MDNVQVPNGHRQYLEATTSTVITIDVESNINTQDNSGLPVLKLRLKQPKTDKKVQWSESTVDNEHMNKKKSKCCCIYKKPQEFNESSSDDESECNNCRGHVELKNKK